MASTELKSFKYTARTLSGEREEGVRRAGSETEIFSWLHSKSLIPVEVRKVETVAKKRSRSGKGIRVKSMDIAAFCWQLTTMVEGGVTTASALDIIAKDIDNKQFGRIITEISERLKRGESFSNSVAEYPKTFSNLFCAMIMVSETGGSLPTVLQRLAKYYDERDKLARKVKSALAYPVFCLVVIIAVLSIIMVKVVPMFKVMFEQIEGGMPAMTESLIAVSDVFVENIVYIMVAAPLAAIGLLLYAKTSSGLSMFSRFALALPLFGKIISQAFVAVFCRTAGTLLAAGVSIVDSLDILSKTTGNVVIRSAITTARECVIAGSSVSAGLAATGFFPNMLTSMITVGEESGSLPTILDRTSDYYDRKVGSTITTMTALLEPLMIVTVGVIVLVIVIALYMPIFSASGSPM
jgi:type IV pilus assembly protein PilC